MIFVRENFDFSSLIFFIDRLARETLSSESQSTNVRPGATEDRVRDKVAVVAIGVLTMCAYAYFIGLIRVEVSPVE